MIVPVLLAASLLSAPAPAAAPSVPRPVTAVLALSECRDCRQSPAVVAGGAPGTFVAQWSVPATEGVFYRTFDVNGNGGPERQVGQGREARAGGVGAAPGGGFAIGWEHPGEIFVQHLGPTGNLMGNPVLVTGDVTGTEDTHTTLTVQPDGRILTVWDRIQTTPNVPVQVVGRHVDASGARGPDVGIWISWGATFPAVCASPAVGAAAAWTQRGGSPAAPGPAGVSFRTLRGLNQAGEIGGEPIEVVPGTEAAEDLGVAVACAPDGRFAVAWHTRRKPAQAGLDVVVQRFDAAEAKVGAPARVNAMAAGNQTSPALLFRSDGRLLVVWASVNRNKAELRGRWLSPQGKPAGPEFVLHKAAARASLASPKLAPVGERGQFVLVWNEAGRNFARVFL